MKKHLRIFIGSSSWYAPKNKDDPDYRGDEPNEIDRKVKPEILAEREAYLLQRVFKALIDAGFEPCPWWNRAIWTDAESFFYSLRKASEEHDGGIFILGPDDSVTASSNGADSFSVTRDNVVFEFGMFLAAKGRERACGIFDKPKGCDPAQLKVMSDLQGINYPTLQEELLEERIEYFFSQPSGDLRLDERTMYANPDLWRSKRDREFEHWKTKGMYVGTQSAVLWGRIEGHRHYERYIGFLHMFIDRIASEGESEINIYQDIDNIVSLGPGSGKTDLALITRIGAHNERICYVPVDINPVLASMAATEVSADKLIRAPFLIVDDFESKHSMIRDVINGKAHEIGHRNLFVMLGVTFSNLEDAESLFFLKMKDWMKKGDYFLLDVNIFPEKKPRGAKGRAEELSDELLHEGNDEPDWLSFLAYAIVNKHPQNYRYNAAVPFGSNDQCKEVVRVDKNQLVSLKDLIMIEEISKEETMQYSHVKETKVLVGRLKDNNETSDLFILRRYSYDAIYDALCWHFDVKGMNGIEDYDKNVHRALFLLKLKDSNSKTRKRGAS